MAMGSLKCGFLTQLAVEGTAGNPGNLEFRLPNMGLANSVPEKKFRVGFGWILITHRIHVCYIW